MGMFLVIAIPIALFILSLIVPVIAKIFIHMDYAFLVLIVWAYIFGASGHNENALLSNSEMHIVTIILIYFVILGIWFGLQQIRIMNIYIFRIAACALAAFVITVFASTGWFGETIANGMNIAWQIGLGVVYFIVAILIRSKDSNLLKT